MSRTHHQHHLLSLVRRLAQFNLPERHMLKDTIAILRGVAECVDVDIRGGRILPYTAGRSDSSAHFSVAVDAVKSFSPKFLSPAAALQSCVAAQRGDANDGGDDENDNRNSRSNNGNNTAAPPPEVLEIRSLLGEIAGKVIKDFLLKDPHQAASSSSSSSQQRRTVALSPGIVHCIGDLARIVHITLDKSSPRLQQLHTELIDIALQSSNPAVSSLVALTILRAEDSIYDVLSLARHAIAFSGQQQQQQWSNLASAKDNSSSSSNGYVPTVSDADLLRFWAEEIVFLYARQRSPPSYSDLLPEFGFFAEQLFNESRSKLAHDILALERQSKELSESLKQRQMLRTKKFGANPDAEDVATRASGFEGELSRLEMRRLEQVSRDAAIVLSDLNALLSFAAEPQMIIDLTVMLRRTLRAIGFEFEPLFRHSSSSSPASLSRAAAAAAKKQQHVLSNKDDDLADVNHESFLPDDEITRSTAAIKTKCLPGEEAEGGEDEEQQQQQQEEQDEAIFKKERQRDEGRRLVVDEFGPDMATLGLFDSSWSILPQEVFPFPAQRRQPRRQDGVQSSENDGKNKQEQEQQPQKQQPLLESLATPPTTHLQPQDFTRAYLRLAHIINNYLVASHIQLYFWLDDTPVSSSSTSSNTPVGSSTSAQSAAAAQSSSSSSFAMHPQHRRYRSRASSASSTTTVTSSTINRKAQAAGLISASKSHVFRQLIATRVKVRRIVFVTWLDACYNQTDRVVLGSTKHRNATTATATTTFPAIKNLTTACQIVYRWCSISHLNDHPHLRNRILRFIRLRFLPLLEQSRSTVALQQHAHAVSHMLLDVSAIFKEADIVRPLMHHHTFLCRQFADFARGLRSAAAAASSSSSTTFSALAADWSSSSFDRDELFATPSRTSSRIASAMMQIVTRIGSHDSLRILSRFVSRFPGDDEVYEWARDFAESIAACLSLESEADLVSWCRALTYDIGSQEKMIVGVARMWPELEQSMSKERSRRQSVVVVDAARLEEESNGEKIQDDGDDILDDEEVNEDVVVGEATAAAAAQTSSSPPPSFKTRITKHLLPPWAPVLKRIYNRVIVEPFSMHSIGTFASVVSMHHCQLLCDSVLLSSEVDLLQQQPQQHPLNLFLAGVAAAISYDTQRNSNNNNNQQQNVNNINNNNSNNDEQMPMWVAVEILAAVQRAIALEHEVSLWRRHQQQQTQQQNDRGEGSERTTTSSSTTIPPALFNKLQNTFVLCSRSTIGGRLTIAESDLRRFLSHFFQIFLVPIRIAPATLPLQPHLVSAFVAFFKRTPTELGVTAHEARILIHASDFHSIRQQFRRDSDRRVAEAFIVLRFLLDMSTLMGSRPRQTVMDAIEHYFVHCVFPAADSEEILYVLYMQTELFYTRFVAQDYVVLPYQLPYSVNRVSHMVNLVSSGLEVVLERKRCGQLSPYNSRLHRSTALVVAKLLGIVVQYARAMDPSVVRRSKLDRLKKLGGGVDPKTGKVVAAFSRQLAAAVSEKSQQQQQQQQMLMLLPENLDDEQCLRDFSMKLRLNNFAHTLWVGYITEFPQLRHARILQRAVPYLLENMRQAWFTEAQIEEVRAVMQVPTTTSGETPSSLKSAEESTVSEGK